MKFLLLSLAFSCALSSAGLAEFPVLPTGADIAPIVKLVVRSDRGEQLTELERDQVAVMVAYLKGFTDGLHPMQVLFPQGPVSIPNSVTIGQFAQILDVYIDKNPDCLKDPTSLVLFNCACLAYKNPNFMPALMPRRVEMPELKPKP